MLQNRILQETDPVRVIINVEPIIKKTINNIYHYCLSYIESEPIYGYRLQHTGACTGIQDQVCFEVNILDCNVT